MHLSSFFNRDRQLYNKYLGTTCYIERYNTLDIILLWQELNIILSHLVLLNVIIKLNFGIKTFFQVFVVVFLEMKMQ